MRLERLEEIVDRYPMVDVFILVVDRDGNPHRRAALDNLEERVAAKLKEGASFLSENAWQESEVWVLAGHNLEVNWQAVRQEPHAKEVYFEPFVHGLGLQDEPGQGRRTLAREAATRYARIRQLCPEDVAALEGRLSDVV